MLLWRAWPTDLASGVRENWLSADVITMALSHTEKEKEGLGADLKEKFKRGELDIPVETAKTYISVCDEFKKRVSGAEGSIVDSCILTRRGH